VFAFGAQRPSADRQLWRAVIRSERGASHPVGLCVGSLGRLALALHGEEVPGPGNAFEFVFAAVGEVQTGTRHERRDGPRHEHFTCARQRRDAGADVDGDPGHVVTVAFNLASMGTRSNVKPRFACPIDHFRCAADSAGGTVEGRKHPVTGGAHLDATVTGEYIAQHLVVTTKQ
jgi:hypothetical protein